MSKICVEENCTYPVFSKGMCKKHWLGKYGKTINRISKKGSAKPRDKRVFQEADWNFYTQMWKDTRGAHICYECGVGIPEARTVHFHHILPKQRYPQFRYEIKNIVLLCWTCHSQVETFLDKCPRTKALTEETRRCLLNN